jgi:hypothetical protein
MLVYLLGGSDRRGDPVFAACIAKPTERAFRPGVGAYIGLPYALRGPVRATGGLYIVCPNAYAADPQRQAEARALLATLTATAAAAADPAAAIDAVYKRVSQGNLQPAELDLWSLMLLQWVIDERPAAYLLRNEPLGDVWLQRIVPHERTSLPWLQQKYAALIPSKLMGNVQDVLPDQYRAVGDMRACVNVVPDFALVSAYEEAADRRGIAIQFALGASEHYARAFVFVAGLLPVAGSSWLIALACDVGLAYVDFLIALHEHNKAIGEGDGNATAEDAVYDSATAMVMPIAMHVPVVGTLLQLKDMVTLAYAMVGMLIGLLQAMIDALERIKAAFEEGFFDWQEFDEETGWLIPFEDAP